MSSDNEDLERTIVVLRMSLQEMVMRARELSDMSLKQLRSLHPDNVDGSSTFKPSKGECVEAILYEEFQHWIEYRS